MCHLRAFSFRPPNVEANNQRPQRERERGGAKEGSARATCTGSSVELAAKERPSGFIGELASSVQKSRNGPGTRESGTGSKRHQARKPSGLTGKEEG
jgi:hypothetical protein